MAESFQVDIVSPESIVWSGEAELIIARTLDGEIGIMAGHEPVMAALATGSVMIDTGSERLSAAVHGGFLQVLNDQVTLLADRAEIASDVDEAKAKAEGLREQAEALEEITEGG